MIGRRTDARRLRATAIRVTAWSAAIMLLWPAPDQAGAAMVLKANQPVVTEVVQARCLRAGERAVLRIELDFAAIAPGSAIVVAAEPSGRLIGTIAPFGVRPGRPSGYNLIVPDDLSACRDGRAAPLRIRLTLEPPAGADASAGTRLQVVVRDLKWDAIPAAD